MYIAIVCLFFASIFYWLYRRSEVRAQKKHEDEQDQLRKDRAAMMSRRIEEGLKLEEMRRRGRLAVVTASGMTAKAAVAQSRPRSEYAKPVVVNQLDVPPGYVRTSGISRLEDPISSADIALLMALREESRDTVTLTAGGGTFDGGGASGDWDRSTEAPSCAPGYTQNNSDSSSSSSSCSSDSSSPISDGGSSSSSGD